MRRILDIIHREGEEAYIVGGCVRDILLGVEPNDWDITTSAPPEKVKILFNRTIDTGLSHGTVTVMMHNEAYEVTTYRVESEYLDYRRPKEVVYTKCLKEDLLRRDFTINAMAYNDQEGVVDLYDGIGDLKKGIIRCVGNPTDRFNEDALRMLRAIRFSAKLGFEIEEETYEAIGEYARLIQHVSAERIQMEMTKTLISKAPFKIRDLVATGLIDYIIPEFLKIVGMPQNNPHHHLSVDEHTYLCLSHIDEDVALRWTMYLHDIGKGVTRTTDENGIDHFYGHEKQSRDIAKSVLRRLKFDNKTIDRVIKLIQHHDDDIEDTPKAVRKSLSKIGQDYYDDLLDVREADIRSQHEDLQRGKLIRLAAVREQYRAVLEAGSCVTIKDLAVNGHDLMELGVVNGRAIGTALKGLLKAVLEDPKLNEKEVLLDYVKTHLNMLLE